MSSFSHWIAAITQAFSQWIESWVARDYPAFRERSCMVLAQSSATVRGTMVRGPDGQSGPWLQVFADHPAVRQIMGWHREVLPVLQQPLFGLPVLAVATVLDVQSLWLYDRQLRRVIPAVTERRTMAVLMGSKQLAPIQGDDAQGHVPEAVIPPPEGDDNVAVDARHTLVALGMAAVVEAPVRRTTLGSRVHQGPGAGQGRCHQGGRTGLWLGAPNALLTQPEGGAVALAAAEPPEDVERTDDTQQGVHVGRSKTEPVQLCHCTIAGGCVALQQAGVLRCVAGTVVAVLSTRLRPVAVGTPAVMPRMRGDGARLGTSLCLRPTLRTVSGASRYG